MKNFYAFVRSNVLSWGLLLALVVVISGCGPGNPANKSQAEIETYIKQEVKLETLTLTKNADGSYTGTGKDKEGVTFEVSVKADPQNARLSYTAKGGDGTEASGALQNK